MGCDIHAVFQVKKPFLTGEGYATQSEGYKWEDIDSDYNEDRHYALFAWLAGVRNSTTNPITPIKEPRGLPEDLKLDGDKYDGNYRGDYTYKGQWLGDHSHSWLTADEILNTQLPIIKTQGYVTLEYYREWDKVSEPKRWKEYINEANAHVSYPEDINERTTHVIVGWEVIADFEYFTNEIMRLRDKHAPNEVRMVFGFDS